MTDTVEAFKVVDGATFEWWATRPDMLPEVVITHMRARFYESCTWDQHPWSAQSTHGADFKHEWAVEKFEENTTGRMGCDGLCEGGPPNLCQRPEHRIYGWWSPASRSISGGMADQFYTRVFRQDTPYPNFRTQQEAAVYLLGHTREGLEKAQRREMRYWEAINRLSFLCGMDA